MARRRSFSYRRFRRRARFHFAVIVTIVVVTYLLVPWVASLVEAGRGYGPGVYDPKDGTRQQWILRHGLKPVPVVTPLQLIINTGLIFLVVIVWVSVFPARR